MKSLWMFLSLCLAGCANSPANGRVAYVVNHLNGSAATQEGPGKSYAAEPCELRLDAGKLELSCGEPGKPSWLILRGSPVGGGLDASLGKSISQFEGEVQLGAQKYPLQRGVFTLQTLEAGVARGNFSAHIGNPPWEVVGSFVANCK